MTAPTHAGIMTVRHPPSTQGSGRDAGPYATATPVRVPARLGAHLRTRLERQVGQPPRIRLSRNENVYNAGEAGNALYYLERGLIKTSSYSWCGKACLLNLHTAGDIIGESALLGRPRPETATAMTPAVLRRVPRDEFLRLLVAEDLTEDWLCYLTSRMSEQKEVITLLVTMDSKQRLADTLLRLGAKLGTRSGHTVRIEQRITQEELAEMVGTTRSRVGLFLKQFRSDGLIRNGSDATVIIDERGLGAYAGQLAGGPAESPLHHSPPAW